ncbi:SCO4225 family membrane protein [Streptomyces sp. NPDC058257]|uniref:SCO4225 family membrane protein n=1 Tax=Streptomyces sp. NPDC058257 TaxID=3346409 RepID=UPI0036EF7462
MPGTNRRPKAGTIIALAYLAACAVLLVWALVVSAVDSSDESMAGVIPLLATAPASFVLLALPDGTVMVIVAVAVGALVNAAIINWCARALSRGRGGGRGGR